MPEVNYLRDRLVTSVREIFGDRCKAAWLSGSFVYGGAQRGQSDIDVVLVLDEAVSAPADDRTIGLIKQFVGDYLDLHAVLGFKPDTDFPGEFLSAATAEEAAEGRGLACDGSQGQLRLLPVEDGKYWLDHPGRWYRAWLGMIAFSRYLTGSRTYYSTLKERAWKTVLTFVLLRSPQQTLDFAEIFNGLTLRIERAVHLLFAARKAVGRPRIGATRRRRVSRTGTGTRCA